MSDYMVKSFAELTTEELFQIYQARVAVFVVEQACPYMEVDELDKESLHVFKVLDGKLAAYCRLYPKGEQMALGRVLVSQEYRKHKLGRELVQTALDIVAERFPDKPIYAQAQAYLENFYASFDFERTSEVYLEDDIPHVDMEKAVKL